jgi:hypothetical protein
MLRLERRAVIRYLTVKNRSPAEIATELQSVYGTDALKYLTVSNWRLRFQDGRTAYLIWHVLEGPLAVILRLLFSHCCSNFHLSHAKHFVAG